jgi:hypothetical protein
MRLLILDFLARRWWIFLVIFAFAVLGAWLGRLLVFTPFVMVAMIIDQQKGWLRAVNGLALSRRAQATAWWSIGVLLPTLTATLGLLVGALIFHLTRGPQLIPLPDAPTYTLVLNPKYFAPGFSVAVGVSFGFGYAALCFLIAFVLPTRVRGKFALACLAMFMPMAQFGPMFIGFNLPFNPGMMVTWHWVALASVPILALLSWLAAPWIFGARVVGHQSLGRANFTPSTLGRSRGLAGIQIFIADLLIFYGLMVLVLIGAMVGINLMFSSGSPSMRDFPKISTNVCVVIFVVGGLNYDLRILRCLPLATSRLALLRLLGPLIGGLCYAVSMTAVYYHELGGIPSSLLFFNWFFSFGGGCALVVACRGQFKTWVYLLAMVPSMLLISLGTLIHHPLIAPFASFILIINALVLLLSFTLFKRGLGKSDVYQKQGVIFSNASLLKR